MSDQLALAVETPLRFNVRRWDPSLTAEQNFNGEGVLLDTFAEDELHTYEHAPEKTWHEASIWAYLAAKADRR